MTCAPTKDSGPPGHPPSSIRVFAVRFMGSQGPKASSCRQQRLVRLSGCPDWSESLLGAQIILLVLSCCSSFMFSCAMAHFSTCFQTFSGCEGSRAEKTSRAHHENLRQEFYRENDWISISFTAGRISFLAHLNNIQSYYTAHSVSVIIRIC